MCPLKGALNFIPTHKTLKLRVKNYNIAVQIPLKSVLTDILQIVNKNILSSFFNIYSHQERNLCYHVNSTAAKKKQSLYKRNKRASEVLSKSFW